MSDDLTKALENLTGDLPKARLNLTDQEKDDLVQKVGVRTARSIDKAKRELPIRRIPFLFSAVDTQAVVDLIANDLTSAIQRALEKTKARGL